MFALGRTAFVGGFETFVLFEDAALFFTTFSRADRDFDTFFFVAVLVGGFFLAGERLETDFTTLFATFFLAAGFVDFLARVRAPSVFLAFAGLRFEVVLPVDFLAI